jgi:hypothetical protein
MSERTCPKCEKSLGAYDHFFCSVCGKKLPKELVRTPRPLRLRTFLLKNEKHKRGANLLLLIKNKNFLYAAGLLIVILGVIFGIYKTGVVDLILLKLKQQNLDTFMQPEEKTGKSNFLDLQTSIKVSSFGEYTFASYIPADTAIYFEAFDLAKISSYFEGDEEMSELFSRSQLLLEESFVGAYLTETSDWLFVFVPKDTELVKKVLEDIEHEEWRLEVIEDRLFVTKEEDSFNLIDKVTGKIEPSLALNPEYIKKIQSLPAEQGSVQVTFMTDSAKETLRNSLGGLDQEMIGYINEVIGSQFDSLIVK